MFAVPDGSGLGIHVPLQEQKTYHQRTEVKWVLTEVGINNTHYSGHSFRFRDTSTATERGINDMTIKMMGRWKSNAYQIYIRILREQLALVSQQLIGAPPKEVSTQRGGRWSTQRGEHSKRWEVEHPKR